MPRPKILDNDTLTTALIELAKGTEMPKVIDSIVHERGEKLIAKNRKRIRDALDEVNPRARAFDRNTWGELYDNTRLQYLTNIKDKLTIEVAACIQDLSALRLKAINGNASMSDYQHLVSSTLQMQRYLDEQPNSNNDALPTTETAENLSQTDEDKLLDMHKSAVKDKDEE